MQRFIMPNTKSGAPAKRTMEIPKIETTIEKFLARSCIDGKLREDNKNKIPRGKRAKVVMLASRGGFPSLRRLKKKMKKDSPQTKRKDRKK